MKRLNNKGFAVTTLLYGILTIIIVILMLLLNIMRSSYNKENLVIDDISYYLDDCIGKQVELEKCYKEYNDNEEEFSCSDYYEAYTTCVGLNRNNVVTGSVAQLNKLAIDLGDATSTDFESDGATGLTVDTFHDIDTIANGNRRYIYIGSDPSNYIIINNVEGRIMSIERDGTIKVIVKEIPDIQLDTQNVVTWENTTLRNEFKIEYDNMDFRSKFTEGNFYTDNLCSGRPKLNDNFVLYSNQVLNKGYYGLPTIADYLKASSNISIGGDKCSPGEFTGSILNNFVTIACRGESNWMDDGEGCYWTMTKWIEEEESDKCDITAPTKYMTYSKDGIEVKSPSEKCIASMVFVLKADTTVGVDGTGTKDNPFVVDLR